MSRSTDQSLAKYLWKEQHVVFLNSAIAHDFNLLDVLVKHGSHGVFHRGPVLVRIGSIFQFGIAAIPAPPPMSFHDAEDVLDEDEEEEEEEVPQDTALSLETLKEELDALMRRPGSAHRGVHIKENKLGDWRWKNDSSLSVMATAAVMDEAAGSSHVGINRNGICTIKNIKSKSVDTASLNQVFSRCTLDVQQILQLCSSTLREVNEVWVVNKILYTSGIHVDGVNQVTGGAQLQLPTVAMVGVGMRSAQTSSHEVNNAPDPQPFGFQAIRLKFNGSTGKVISCPMEMGKGRAVIRRDDRPQADVVRDPQKEPQYNMADLLDMDIINSSHLNIIAAAASVNHDNNSVDPAVTEEIP